MIAVHRAPPPPCAAALAARLQLLVDSYRRLTGRDLLVPDTQPLGGAEEIGERDEAPGARRAATKTYQDDRRGSEHRATQRFARAAIYSACPLPEAVWHAPRVIVAHGTEADPVFFYGNRLALAAFEMPYADFVRLPSRFSAEPVNREERARLLERVARDGYIDDYSGVRIAASGRRFCINAATVWNLVDADGTVHGQAATFASWQDL